jgi:hypothetical protein
METIANLSKLRELQSELDSMLKAKSELPRLSLEDHECVSDNYQMHLELQEGICCLKEEIKDLERSGLGD